MNALAEVISYITKNHKDITLTHYHSTLMLSENDKLLLRVVPIDKDTGLYLEYGNSTTMTYNNTEFGSFLFDTIYNWRDFKEEISHEEFMDKFNKEHYSLQNV